MVKLKDVKLRPRTAEHDCIVKVRKIRELLGEGNRVRVSVVFRGREFTHPEVGQKTLRRVIGDLRDVAIIEQALRMEGRRMFVLLAQRPSIGRPPGGATKPRLWIVRPDPR